MKKLRKREHEPQPEGNLSVPSQQNLKWEKKIKEERKGRGLNRPLGRCCRKRKAKFPKREGKKKKN